MTRINVVPAEELSDQWLLAEYRELPRVIKQDIDIKDAPHKYCLGKGHMKWARFHLAYMLDRFHDICLELDHRGFKHRFTYNELRNYASRNCFLNGLWFNGYFPDESDIELNRERLIEKYRDKPEFYKWTNRTKPEWLEI